MHRFAAALLLTSVCVLAGCGSQSVGAARTPAAVGSSRDRIGQPLNSPLPAAIRDLSFTNSNGRHVSLAALAGHPVVLSDAMTLCQETCPLDTATLVRTARAERRPASARSPVFLSLTVDPARDTVAQLHAYRDLFGRPPADWQAWTGSVKNVNALWSYFGVWRHRVHDDPGPAPHNWRTGAPLTYDVQHSDEVFFLDGAGHERFVLEGVPYAAGGSVPRRLLSFMDAAGRKNLTHPKSTAWTQAQAQSVLASLPG